MQTLTLEQLRATVGAGGVTGATIKAQGPAFLVEVSTQAGGTAVLVLTRTKEPRRFADPRKAMELLLGVGIAAGAYDVQLWSPGEESIRPGRPDSAAVMKRAHAVARKKATK
jgi:hypothetical protein